MGILRTPYDPLTHKLAHVQPIMVRLENTTLRISYPKKPVTRLAFWKDVKLVENFLTEETYNISSILYDRFFV